jgi:predicted DNA-binding transcriptional regulator AlpA
MNENVVLMSLKEDELKFLISETLREVLIGTELTNNIKEPPDQLIDRQEALRLLHLSSTSLWSRMKDGTVPFKRIGRRVLFSKNEILKCIKNEGRL